MERPHSRGLRSVGGHGRAWAAVGRGWADANAPMRGRGRSRSRRDRATGGREERARMRHERAHLPAISAPRAVVGAKATGSRARAPEILGARVPPGHFRKARQPPEQLCVRFLCKRSLGGGSSRTRTLRRVRKLTEGRNLEAGGTEPAAGMGGPVGSPEHAAPVGRAGRSTPDHCHRHPRYIGERCTKQI